MFNISFPEILDFFAAAPIFNMPNLDEESETKVTKKEEVKEEPDAAEGDAAAPGWWQIC